MAPTVCVCTTVSFNCVYFCHHVCFCVLFLLHVRVYGVIVCTINPIIFSPLKFAIFDLTAF